MCQLTLAGLNDFAANSLYILVQFYQNTKTQNKDGCGIFTAGGELRKTALDVNLINNLGTWIPKGLKKSKRPVIGHVRLATWHNNKKVVDDSSAHPFDFDKLVLAHNGALELKNSKDGDRYKHLTVDSELFGTLLNEKYTGDNFVKALQDTMALFNGTFAFLIYSKLENRYYVAKGKTKKLHIAKVNINNGKVSIDGVVINTDKEDLRKSLLVFNNFAEMTYSAKVTAEEIKEIADEKIYVLNEVDNILEEIGEIKETAKVTSNFTVTTNIGTNTISPAFGINSFEDKLQKLTDELELSLQEVDYILYLTKEKGFLHCSPDEIIEVLEVLKAKTKHDRTKEKKELWKEISEYYWNPLSLYEKYGQLTFPWMYSSTKDLKSVARAEKVR